MQITGTIQRLMMNMRIAGGINLRKPRLAGRLVAGYARAQFRNNPRNSLRFMDIALSYVCNFHCDHCSALALDRGKKDDPLTISDYERVAAQAMAMGVCAFHFTGGEPLIRKDIFDVIRAFRPKENLISIQTNGWHVDEKFLDGFREVGGDILCVSVDSANPARHDEFRSRKGSWERAISALKMARKKGFQTLMTSTITHLNLGGEDMEQMIRLSREMGAIMALNLAVPAGEWRGNSEMLLDEDDRRKLNLILRRNPHVRTDFESNWKIQGCPAFKEKCYLSPYGDVLPCPFIQVSFGNVRADSLVTIRDGALQHPYLKNYHNICIAAEDQNFIECAGCYNVNAAAMPVKHQDSPLFNKPVPITTVRRQTRPVPVPLAGGPSVK